MQELLKRSRVSKNDPASLYIWINNIKRFIALSNPTPLRLALYSVIEICPHNQLLIHIFI